MQQKNARHIIRQTISQHFPELKIKIIRIIFRKGKDYYMRVGFLCWTYWLFIDEDSLQFSETAFKGCLAHELIHIKHHGFTALLKWLLSLTKETEIERETDRLVITEKGMGKELLQFHREHNKNYRAYKPADGLTTREIKQLIKKHQP